LFATSVGQRDLPGFLYCEIGEKEGTTATKIIHTISDATKEIIVLNPDDVGLLNEDKWELIKVCESRFCFKYRQKEWLL
jgi:hypothetical protein